MRQATKWGVNAGVAVAGQDNGRLPGPTGKRSRHDPSLFFFFFLSPLSVPTRADRKNEWTRSDCQQQPSSSSSSAGGGGGEKIQNLRPAIKPNAIFSLLLLPLPPPLLLPCASLRDRKKILHEHSASSLPTLQM